MKTPAIYVIAGANGTGKTTATFDLVPPTVPVINSDEIARQIKLSTLPNINLQELGNREAVHLTERYLSEQQTFGIETNLADVDTWKFLIGVQKSEYLFYLIFLCTDDLMIINNRIKERTLRGEHFIRPDIVLERYMNGLKLLQHYLRIPNQIRFIDSSEQNILIAEMQDGKIEIKTEKIPAWFQNYILVGSNSDNEKQQASVKDADSIEAVRLQYERLKREG